MRFLIFFLIITTLHLVSTAPSYITDLEQSMLNKLHKPLYSTTRPVGGGHREEFRKGEGCRGGKCGVNEGCEDCQYAIPIVFDEKHFIKH